MTDFIFNGVLWTLALYGLVEIIKNLVYFFTYTNFKGDGIYLIIAVKNQESGIEGFLRTVLFRFIYGKEDSIKDIIVTDLNSSDETTKILDKLQKEHEYIKVANWKECKEMFDNIDSD